MGKNTRWSIDENASLFRLKAEGRSIEMIAARIGRSLDSVKERWRWVNKTEEQRQERRTQINMTRNHKALVPGRSYATVARRPSEEILAERDRRVATPRTIGAWLLGDPPPGYSALDRKQVQA